MGVRDRSELMISVMATRAICSTVILNKSSILRPTEAQSIQCAGSVHKNLVTFFKDVKIEGEGLFMAVLGLSGTVKAVTEAGLQRGGAEVSNCYNHCQAN
ncbi:unnamed protein product [Euphydryas editha]|uniref:Uncharacterized protein n=1 Tax=Euphydryas editha TaxID=104508 RepID=A0AAU9TLB5_EUPED|nr:unnamed protein product [Euphydryas editha]